MSGNRILFLIVVAILVLLVGAMLILATDSPAAPALLGSLLQTLAAIGILLLIVRFLRNAFGRR